MQQIIIDGVDLTVYVEALVEAKVAEAIGQAGAKRWYTGEDAASYLGLKLSTVYDKVASGELERSGEPGTRLRFSIEQLDTFAAGR